MYFTHSGLRVLVIILLFVTKSYSQQREAFIYVPDTLVKSSPDRLTKIKTQLDADLKDLATKQKDQREFISKRYKGRYDYFKSSIEEGDFLINSDLEKYLVKILKEVLAANHNLDPAIQLFVSRNTVPNAYSTGDGNIIFNIGLLNKMDNDAEIAFVMCHELSHQFLQHTKKKLALKAEKYTDKDYVKKLRKTLREEYNVNQKLSDLIMPGLLSEMQFSRKDELEADSLGLIFLSNTRFEKKASISVIEKLDSIDLFYDKDPLALSMVLNCAGYTYQARWEPEVHKSSLQVIEDEKDTLEDSLKTHPDCKIRFQSIMRILPQNKNNIGVYFFSDSAAFRKLKLQAEAENIHTMLLWDNIGRMMFYAYHSTVYFPDNLYSRIFLSIGFARLNHLQRTHKVNTEFPLPINDFEVNYNKMLNFLTNLNREESASLGYYLLRPVQEPLKKYEDYLAALAYSAFAMNKKEELTELIGEYTNSFPKGKYTQLFKEINTNTNQTNKK